MIPEMSARFMTLKSIKVWDWSTGENYTLSEVSVSRRSREIKSTGFAPSLPRGSNRSNLFGLVRMLRCFD